MKKQIVKNKMQYQKLLDSGVIKDQKKKEAMMVLIGQLDDQILSLNQLGANSKLGGQLPDSNAMAI